MDRSDRAVGPGQDAPDPPLRRIDVGEVRLRAADAGSGPLVVLLHGFPEFWYGWRHQIPALAAAGFRAVAPDLRGYGGSDRPAGVAAYGIEHLAADVLGLLDALGESRAHLVGHDWGGVLAWHLEMHHPDRVHRLAILNAPHPAAYVREVRRGRQLARSWYALAFQVPALPEWALRRRDFRALRRVLQTDPARPGAFNAQDLARYRDAWSEPGTIGAMVNWYRAAIRRGVRTGRGYDTLSVRAPTLLLWGDRDRYLVPALADGLGRWVPDLRVVRFPAASHWLQHDEPDRVNTLLAEHLRGAAERRNGT